MFGTPGRIRTCYPRLRRPMLYPIELQAQNLKPNKQNIFSTGLQTVDRQKKLVGVERLQNTSCILPCGPHFVRSKLLPAILSNPSVRISLPMQHKTPYVTFWLLLHCNQYLSGRGREIRTPDILLPKQARYQTALYPVILSRFRFVPLSMNQEAGNITLC
jgi:hypothetical protein